MTIAFVASNLVNNIAGGTTTITVTGLTLTGNATVLACATANNVNLSSVTDNAGVGNAYVVQQTALQWFTFPAYLSLVTGVSLGGSPTSISFNFSSNPGTGFNAIIDSFSGVGSVNAISNFAEDDNTASPADSLTTTVDSCALWACIFDNSGSVTLPSGFSLGTNNDANNGQVTAYQIAGGAEGAKTITWSIGATNQQTALGAVALAPILLDAIANPLYRVRPRRWR